MNGATIVSVISIIACLALVASNGELRGLGLSRRVLMAVVWVAIIVVVAAIMTQIDKPAPGLS